MHPSVASSLNELGLVAKHLRKFDEAEGYFQRMLDIERAVHPKHELVGVALANLAGVYSERGDYGRAEGLLREELKLQPRDFSQGDSRLPERWSVI